VEQRAGL